MFLRLQIKSIRSRDTSQNIGAKISFLMLESFFMNRSRLDEKMSEKLVELQHQVRNNADDLQDFLRDLGSWYLFLSYPLLDCCFAPMALVLKMSLVQTQSLK